MFRLATYKNFVSVKNLGLVLILLPSVLCLAFLLIMTIAGGMDYSESIILLAITVFSIAAFIIAWKRSYIGSLVTIGSALSVLAPLMLFVFTAGVDPWATFGLFVFPLLSCMCGVLIVFLSGKRARKEKLDLYATCLAALGISIVWTVLLVN